MKLYLINKNPIISKLVALSVSKLGVEMEETQEIDSNLSAEIILLDDECFEQESFESYKAANPEAKFGLFYAKSTERLEGFDEYIQKPFLPTDLVKILSKISGITPIEHHHIAKESSNDEILGLEGAESLDNLDEELDLSSFDDLQLDDEDSTTESSAGDEPLDFGAESEEGIEEATTENPDEQLDFGAEETESVEESDPNAQLDFGAEEEDKDLNVLDKGDVEEIKDLLSNDEPTQEEESPAKEVADSNLGDDLDFSDLQAELDSIEVGEESEAKAESKEELPSLEQENAEIGEDSKGIEDFDFALDEVGGIAESQGDSMESENDALEAEQKFADFANTEQGDLESAPSETPQDIDFNALESDFGGGETSEAQSGLDSLGEEMDLSALDEKPQEEALQEDLGAFDEQESLESLGGEEALEDTALASEALENIEMDLPEETSVQEVSTQETSSEEASVEATEEIALEEQAESKADDAAGADEFDALSLEGMSEALGEPIAKAPNPAPIVPNSDSALPSNIQANSLESLITALQALQAQNLKDLLSGATISINIQFPKKD